MITRLRNLEFNVPAVRGAMRQTLFPEGRWTTVRWGPLRGMRVQNREDVNLHLLIGAWELRSFELLGRVLDTLGARKWNGAAIDIGANMGAYSYWLNRNLPQIQTIYAFEPSPETAQRLREQLKASGASKVEVIQAACVDTDRTVEFFLSHHHHSSSVVQSFAHAEVESNNRTSLRVRGNALDSFLESVSLPIHFIKIDIEGGAVYALPGMTRTIAQHRPLVLIESHTPDEDHSISRMLLTNQYEAFRLNTHAWVTQRDRDHNDDNGVWGTMLCVPNELTSQLTPVLGARA